MKNIMLVSCLVLCAVNSFSVFENTGALVVGNEWEPPRIVCGFIIWGKGVCCPCPGVQIITLDEPTVTRLVQAGIHTISFPVTNTEVVVIVNGMLPLELDIQSSVIFKNSNFKMCRGASMNVRGGTLVFENSRFIVADQKDLVIRKDATLILAGNKNYSGSLKFGCSYNFAPAKFVFRGKVFLEMSDENDSVIFPLNSKVDAYRSVVTLFGNFLCEEAVSCLADSVEIRCHEENV
ncbi:hypothetical protein HOD08_02735 [bacterium]|mgnify:CR=1 FL=1|nr:hypothetical protein [bacterium]